MTQPGYGYMRASDAERERAVDVLKAGFSEGRLSQDEYADRAGQAQAARTYGDLAALIADLPVGPLGSLLPPPSPPPVPPPPAPPALPPPGFPPYPAYPGHPGYPPALAARPPYPLPPAGAWFQAGSFYPLSSVYAPVNGPGYPVLYPPAVPLAVPQQRDPLAVTSVAVALAAVTFPPAAVAAVGLGLAALARIRRTGKLGRNFALTGIALGTLGTLLFVTYVVAWLTA
jgi:Domain of unknown function (DUF1707)/Domain of unknown function (DUF4190)